MNEEEFSEWHHTQPFSLEKKRWRKRKGEKR